MGNDPTNRILSPDGRLSVVPTIARQTPSNSFGDKLRQSASVAANAVAQGAATAAPFIPGGAIISAAVSSVSGLVSNGSAGSQRSGIGAMSSGITGGGGVGASYLSTAGVLSGAYASTGSGTTTSPSVLNPTGSSSGVGPVGLATPGNTSVVTNGVNVNPAQGGDEESTMQSSIADFANQSTQLLNLQITLAKETQVFQTVSNVLKTRHDTVKNTISNVR